MPALRDSYYRLAPGSIIWEKKTISREQCLELNEMAEKITEWG